MNASKEAVRRKVQKSVGEAYAQLRWPTEAEARAAAARRDELEGEIGSEVQRSYAQTKLHKGELSLGCRICAEGAWMCLFVNGLCNRSCAFCPQDRALAEELPPRARLTAEAARSPAAFADYLERFGYRGVAFSGGEPLLVVERVTEFAAALRQRFGSGFYLWLYTNGDLATPERLNALKDAGIDEIRFNLSASEYSLGPVELASRVFPAVTVEVPALPEEEGRLKEFLLGARDLGVSYVNLHQLVGNENNFRSLAGRPYTFLHQPAGAVLESELVALRILRFCLEEGIAVPVQYCGQGYKSLFQEKGHRERVAAALLRPGEELTRLGYVRRLSVALRSNPERAEVVASSRLANLDPSAFELSVCYFDVGAYGCRPTREVQDGRAGEVEEVRLPSGATAQLFRTETEHVEGLDGHAAWALGRLAVDGVSLGGVLHELLRRMAAVENADRTAFSMAAERLARCAPFEELSVGLPEIF